MRRLPVTARKALLLIVLTLMGCVCPAVTTSFASRAHATDEDYRLIQEPEAGYSPIIGLISGAARSVRITMYELTDPAAIDALVDAGVLRETTGRKRDRTFWYTRYLDKLRAGTELED